MSTFFEFDPQKSDSNAIKHGVRLEEARDFDLFNANILEDTCAATL